MLSVPRNEKVVDLDDETSNVELDLLRPADLVVLRAKFYNYALSEAGTGAAKLVRLAGAKPSDCILRVKFPPQCFDERVFNSGSIPEGGLAPLAGNNTRLDFLIPPEQVEISLPKGIEGLLALMRQWSLVLPTAANPPSPGVPAPTIITDPYVADLVRTNTLITPLLHRQVERHTPIVDAATRIELPFDLYLAPNAQARWVHAPQPVGRAGSDGRTWVELWHTRLGVQRPGDPSRTPDESPGTPNLSVRAVWTTLTTTNASAIDTTVLNPPDPRDAERVLDATVRTQIVHQTVNFAQLGLPKAIPIERLYLSALGAWFKTNVTFPTGVISLIGWSHLLSQGRDEKVKTATVGYLFPTGHRAVIETVTERALDARSDGEPYGVLVRKSILHILEPRRTLASGLLRSITILEQTVTDVPHPFTEPPVGSVSAHWITRRGTRFPFNLTLEDSRGHSIAIMGPLIFVEGKPDSHTAAPIITAYNELLLTERQFTADGRAFTFIEQTGDVPDVTTGTLLTQHLTLKAIQPAGEDPGFAPAIDAAMVFIPSVQHLTGLQDPLTIQPTATAGAASSLSCFADFVEPDAEGKIFNKTLKPITLPTHQGGGIGAPQLSVAALSLETGPVLGNASNNVIRTAVFLVGADSNRHEVMDVYKAVLKETKILGSVTLDQLIALAPPTVSDLPGIVTTTDSGTVTSKFLWQPRLDPGLKIDLPGGQATLSARGAGPTLILDSSVEHKVGPTTLPSYQSKGTITNLQLGLLGSSGSHLVTINFDNLRFSAGSGKPSSLNVTLGDPAIAFAGKLDFLQTLVEASKALGSLLGQGAFVEVKPDRIVAGYAIALPQVGLGVFSLQHIDFRAAVTLPFDGKPLSFRLSIAERAHMFNVTCAIFGGGGFFALETSTTDIILLEGAIEFGGSFELDIGVASGGIFAFAGIYIRIAGKEVTVDGYFRCGGYVEVLHLISISIEFNLTLGYENGKFSGSATLLVTVSIAFFSQTVGLSVHRSFGTKSSDPTFKDVVSLDQWQRYGEAFA
jgi:hypothetical protein